MAGDILAGFLGAVSRDGISWGIAWDLAQLELSLLMVLHPLEGWSGLFPHTVEIASRKSGPRPSSGSASICVQQLGLLTPGGQVPSGWALTPQGVAPGSVESLGVLGVTACSNPPSGTNPLHLFLCKTYQCLHKTRTPNWSSRSRGFEVQALTIYIWPGCGVGSADASL